MNPLKPDEMKTIKGSISRTDNRMAGARSRGARFEGRIRILVKTACAARGGAARMTLSDWMEVEQEVERTIQHKGLTGENFMDADATNIPPHTEA